MIADKKKFINGVILLISFSVVLGILFSDVFPGQNNKKQNGLNYLDDLYNSISKESTRPYIAELKGKAPSFDAVDVNATISMGDENQAKQTAMLFEKGGAEVKISGKKIEVNGKLGKVLANCLADCESMYQNDGKTVNTKYGMEERQTMYNWYSGFKALAKELNHQSKFKDSKILDTISKKGIELAYNYYKIEPLKISENLGIVTFSLVFYVIYTMWFGFGVLFIFEGYGLNLEH
jgi:hypothetical protein